MNNRSRSEQRRAIKHHDPIWRSVRIDRGIKILLELFYISVIVVNIPLYQSLKEFPLNFFLFGAALLLLPINQIWQERHWLRVGERRLYALHNDISVQGRMVKDPTIQPATLPFVVSLDWKRNTLLIASVGLAISIALIVAAFFWPETSAQKLWVYLFFAFVIVALAVVLFLSMAYQAFFIRQRIEVSEKGIKTRFRGQEYSIHWQDARVFAQYGSGVMGKYKQFFELSNEQVIVRWSQSEFMGNFLLKIMSNTDGKQDYNWLIGRVNALVSEHTRLPLLRLDNASPIKLNSATRERLQTLSYPDESAGPTPPLAQYDPLVQRLQWGGQSGLVVLIGLGISLLMVLYGVFNVTGIRVTPAQQGFGNAFWLVMGILLLITMVLTGIIVFASQRYWLRLSVRRRRAILQPDAFPAQSQPAHNAGLPQPASLIIRPRASRLFIMFFIEGFILGSLLNGSLFNAIVHQHLELSGLISPFIFALVLGIFIPPFTQRSTQQRIEVNAQGISTRLNMIDSHISWQDARMFARYRIMRTLSKEPRSQYYEISSQQTVVRWLANRSRVATVTTQPKMSQEQYESWLHELANYITERAGLPLVDLDGAPMRPGEK